MNYLLDTCLLSELFKAQPCQGVTNWINTTDEDRLFVSVLTFGEIQKGITKLSDEARKALIQTWLDQQLRQRFSDRTLPIDLNIMLEWGLLCGASETKGTSLPVIDSLIAATAICHNLTVVTRNIKDFSRFPIKTLNPWD